jgi:hypothetical protein
VTENEPRIRKARVIPEDEIRFSEETPIVLSDPERERFSQALDHPPKPSAALRRLMARNAKKRDGNDSMMPTLDPNVEIRWLIDEDLSVSTRVARDEFPRGHPRTPRCGRLAQRL